MPTAFEKAYEQTISTRQVAKKVAEEAVLMSQFKREERYIVIKRKRIDSETEEALRDFLLSYQVPTEECVVVEHDWPIYEAVWSMIEEIANQK